MMIVVLWADTEKIKGFEKYVNEANGCCVVDEIEQEGKRPTYTPVELSGCHPSMLADCDTTSMIGVARQSDIYQAQLSGQFAVPPPRPSRISKL